LRGDLFECHQKCGRGEEWRQIEAWLQDICAITEASAAEALATGRFALSGTAGVGEKPNPLPLSPGKRFSWDEIFVLTAASLAAVVGLVSWVYHGYGRQLKEKLHLGGR